MSNTVAESIPGGISTRALRLPLDWFDCPDPDLELLLARMALGELPSGRPLPAGTVPGGAAWMAPGRPRRPGPAAVGFAALLWAAPLRPAVAEAAPRMHVVRRHESLWSIAWRHLGAGWHWPAIWHLNRRVVPHPNLIFPGQRLRLPGAEATGTVVVRPGDSLWTIAARTLGDAHRWPQLYRANRDRVHAPSHLVAGQVLRLPGTRRAAAHARRLATPSRVPTPAPSRVPTPAPSPPAPPVLSPPPGPAPSPAPVASPSPAAGPASATPIPPLTSTGREIPWLDVPAMARAPEGRVGVQAFATPVGGVTSSYVEARLPLRGRAELRAQWGSTGLVGLAAPIGWGPGWTVAARAGAAYLPVTQETAVDVAVPAAWELRPGLTLGAQLELGYPVAQGVLTQLGLALEAHPVRPLRLAAGVLVANPAVLATVFYTPTLGLAWDLTDRLGLEAAGTLDLPSGALGARGGVVLRAW